MSNKQPSKNASPVVPVRIPPALLTAIEAACERSRQTRRSEPYNRSTFILAAIAEKLAHMERSGSSPAAVPIKTIKTAETHRRHATDQGKPWACECEACTAVRSAIE